jgi:hypothetical protein
MLGAGVRAAMTFILIYWPFVLLACAYAAWGGGKDGRCAAALVLTASILTVPATVLGGTWASTEVAVFTVDASLLLGLYLFMLHSRRWWPIWMVGFHTNAVASHLGSLFETGFWASLYFAAESFWAIPVVLVMVAGVGLDRAAAARRADGGQDRR